MIRLLCLFVVTSQAYAGFKHTDCQAMCGLGLDPCMITKTPEGGFKYICYKNREEQKCKDELKPLSVCIDFFNDVSGNEAIWPDFWEWKQTPLAVPTSVATEAAPTTSIPTTVVSATISPKPTTESLPSSPSTEVASSTPATPATASVDESPVPVEASKRTQVFLVGIGLAALVILAIASCMCCRKSKARSRVSETPLKVGSKELTELEKGTLGSERL